MGKVSVTGQPTRPTQASIPSGSEMSSNPCNYIDYRSGNHNGRPGLRMAVHHRPKSRAQPTVYRLYALSVCDVQRRCSCSCRLWRYISAFTFFTFYRWSNNTPRMNMSRYVGCALIVSWMFTAACRIAVKIQDQHLCNAASRMSPYPRCASQT